LRRNYLNQQSDSICTSAASTTKHKKQNKNNNSEHNLSTVNYENNTFREVNNQNNKSNLLNFCNLDNIFAQNDKQINFNKINMSEFNIADPTPNDNNLIIGRQMDGTESEFELDAKHCTRQLMLSGRDIENYFDDHKKVVSEIHSITSKRYNITKTRVITVNNTKSLVIHTKNDEDFRELLNFKWSDAVSAFGNGVTCKEVVQEYSITTLIPLSLDVSKWSDDFLNEKGIKSIIRKTDTSGRQTDRVILNMKTPRDFCNLLRQKKIMIRGNSSVPLESDLNVWLRQAIQCLHCLKLNHSRNRCHLRDSIQEQCGKCINTRHTGSCIKSARICRLCSDVNHTAMDRFRCPIWIRDTINKNKHYIEVLTAGNVIDDAYGIFLMKKFRQLLCK